MRKARIWVAIILFMLCTLVVMLFLLLNSSEMYKGVKIQGIDIGGYTRNEATHYLQRTMRKEIERKGLNLAFEDYNYIMSYKDIGVDYDYYKAVEQAYAIGRKGNVFLRIKAIVDARIEGYNIGLEVNYDKKKLYLLGHRIAQELDQPSEDAKIKYIKGKFQITPEKIGRRVNIEQLQRMIITSLFDVKTVIIPVEQSLPKITADVLKKIKDELGSFSTSFQGSSSGRVNNINLSARVIGGRVIMPGEVFSFNEVTGSRGKADGYQEAKIILNGEYVDDIGGGVCQVSTTLYNAVLLADLEIVERYPHSIPSSYVDKGRDATVVYGYLDLKFKNDKEIPVYIHTQSRNNILTFVIFGKDEDKNKVIKIKTHLIEEIEAETEIKIDDSLMPGEKIIDEKGRRGYKVETYKIVYDHGKEVARKRISKDYYKPKKFVIRVGPKSDTTEKPLINLVQ